MVVMVAQLCNYANSHWIVLFKWMNCMECELYLINAAKNVYTKTLLFKCLGLLCYQELGQGSINQVLGSISRLSSWDLPTGIHPVSSSSETGSWRYCPSREDPQASEEGSDEAPLVALRNFTSVSPTACPGQEWVEPGIKDPDSPPGARTAFPQTAGPGASQLETLRASTSPGSPHGAPEKEKVEARKEGKKRACRDQLENKRGPIPSY